MSRSEDIDNGIWDELFGLAAHAKLVYVWSWTNTRCHFSGIYQVHMPAICLELGLTDDEATVALADLEDAEKVFYDGLWLWNKARVKRLKTRTVQMCKAVAKDLARVPEDHPYRLQLLELQGASVWQSGEVRLTIREALGYLAGDTRDPHPTHGGSLGSSRNSGSHPRATSVAPMTGTGTGTRSGRRGNRRVRAPEAPTYTDDPALTAIRDEHFPDHEVSTIQGAVATLRIRRQEPTVEAIRSFLEPAA